ncbi:hypothetical protein N7474_007742 [Penicillium riverlandense]|uniref:uncharacterized protein n=1 Tax=Penicillium riverlandense TaxID=1903569 RepID=UPI002546CAC3|nr:uncharacterized protein N7474_007742 [Penicillium riverlandense]KAJ5811441.1 hypothetical protein N7474_007742 [Penicillium riverlandense]
MRFARLSILRATETAQSLRTSSLASRPTQQLGRRLYSNGNEYKQNASKTGYSPWTIGSVAIGGSALMYLLFVGPERASHQGPHAPAAAETVKESPPEPVEGQPREESKATQVAAEKTAEVKSQGQETKRTKPELQNIPPSEVDEPHARGSTGGSGTMSGKQEGLSNADTSNPYVNSPDKSKKREGETESAKLKGTVSTQR